jgi:hypothetical protein
VNQMMMPNLVSSGRVQWLLLVRVSSLFTLTLLSELCSHCSCERGLVLVKAHLARNTAQQAPSGALSASGRDSASVNSGTFKHARVSIPCPPFPCSQFSVSLDRGLEVSHRRSVARYLVRRGKFDLRSP